MNKYSDKNAEVVLMKVESLLDNLKGRKSSWEPRPRVHIRDVYDELSIFDWWNEYLSISQLKEMRSFLKEAIKLGYTGYVCFKVGASGCANGMWAHTEETTTGYSPKCACLYKSFSPDYNYWSVTFDGDKWFPNGHENYNQLTTVKKLEMFVEMANQIRNA